MQDTPPLVALSKKGWQRFLQLLDWAAHNDTFGRMYAYGGLGVLFATTLLWAILGARLQLHNADQLSDPYMFSSWATFHAASFPGAHTFLLKWPIFWLLNVFHVGAGSLLVATVLVALATVGALALILYKIDRRPLVYGTVCLGLALALLLVPAQPYAGGLLPVNFAMLTTRNVEYVFYLAALVLFARANRMWSRSFALGTVLLAVLFASDKLFLSLSAGGALAALLVYALRSNWGLAAFATRWLAGSVLAAIGSMSVLLLISASHLTNLVDSASANPYGVVHSGSGVLLGAVYAVTGLFTNFGANPAYDNTILRQLPGDLAHRLWSYSGPVYLVAAGILAYGLVAMWYVFRPTLGKTPSSVAKLPVANLFSLSLIWSTVAAFGVFILTNHYYAVDARYLTIGLFAGVIAGSVWLRQQDWNSPTDLLLVASMFLAAIGLAVVITIQVSSRQTAALGTVDNRNSLVAAALKHHRVDVLVGDYWRVLPIKLASQGGLTVTPLASCTQPTAALTSGAWQPNLTKHSFAYLITFDGSLTNYPHCSLSQITTAYGQPNATQIIAGTLTQPKEALLFYDDGSHPASVHRSLSATPPALLPASLDQLTATACRQPTIMNVVAHQDDDLLFLSPDLLHNIQSKDCVRTVYLTAGDAGGGKFYWLSRQLGAEAAYSNMVGVKDVWDHQTLILAPNEYATIAAPRNNTRVSLVFMNLPDGNLQGQGFPASDHQSLAKLYSGSISTIRTVDGESVYTSGRLVDALTLLMDTYQPAEIHTQADAVESQYPDHSDHITTGNFTELAATQYDQQHFGGAITIPVKRYIGYPIHGFDNNVSDSDLAQKESAFMAYGQYDNGVCHTMAACAAGTVYQYYLPKQYQQ